MSFRLLSTALLLLAILGTAAAQEPGPLGRGGQGPFPGGRGGRLGGMPPRDNAQPATGTAKITGRVFSAETGTPIRRAQIRITSRDARINRNAMTDSDGRFEILALPASRYRLYVNKAGYVALEYGQARPFEAGKPLDIAAGESLDKIDFSLPRGSVITGRITDEFGDPVADVQVQAMRYQFANGERQLMNAGRVSTTDDLGQFRIFGLMPGDYVVRAALRTNPNAAVAASNTAEAPLGYPGTYYPGVADAAQAQAVTLALGQELSSVGFSLVPARLSRISGTVMSSEGHPVGGAMVMLRAIGAGPAARINIGNGAANQVRPDGTFRLMNVPPGDYVLDVQQRPQSLQNVQGANLGELEFASVPLSVSGDIDGLTVVTTPGGTASGRVVFQGTHAQKATARGIQITAAAPSGNGSLMMAFGGRALGGGRVNNDGTFELRGLAGPHLIRAGGLPAGWAVKTISIDGADITDAPFDFKAGTQVIDLVVTLTDRVTEISGTVRDSRGQAVADYVLVVFPENDKLWGAQSRYVATTRPNQNGTFSITGLPPGRYLATVVPSLENGMQNDVALLAQLRARAENVTLAEGQTLSLNLEMTPQ
ncbi:MAG: carboxypeptidase regulatory-like domain-containing protein [Acidobacteria bacterium]|nr:carboxypeptidase regulatory-like domain-containing protein [Acidobacteriota bacterium]